jgi:serine/threonine protein kinase
MAFFDRIKSVFGQPRLDVKNRFDLLREAISGTMSMFYLARDRRSGEVVGLKILDLPKTAAFEARFKGLRKPAEGEIALRMLHPYIVRTYEHGLTTDGAPYLVMEYLEGPGMNFMILGKDPALQGRRVRYVRQLAEALAAVHASGFLHRDVCPRNLLLIGDKEEIRLTDFGLTVPATPPFMRPGNRTGTPNYMAPELVRRQPTDRRVDIFSFGVTAYEICTLQLPWQSGATGLAAMGHDRPPTDILAYYPNLNPSLAKAIHGCIEPDVHRRYPSMERFLSEIRRVEHEEQPDET